MSQKEIRRYLSPQIDKIGRIFENIAEKRSLDFTCIKSNPDYVELGGGNKTTTFKIWYDSEILNQKTFFKVQINFVEEIRYPIVKQELKSMLKKEDRELQLLFPTEYEEYTRKIPFNTYDIREILSEKVRSILTRKGVKARDFIDVYLITRQLKIKTNELSDDIIDKTRFMLRLYEKYKRNFKEKKKLLESGDIFNWGDEKGILLIDINEKDFYKFLDEFTDFLKDIARKIE